MKPHMQQEMDNDIGTGWGCTEPHDASLGIAMDVLKPSTLNSVP